MLDVFKIGSANRSICATNMNEKSSRSHSIFIITLFQKNIKTESTKAGKLYFVDLAGSERLQKTGITGGQGKEEASNINQSLMTLGLVIKTLSENKKGTFAPFRDSKLTRVLQEALGGNCLTSLCINCSMSEFNDSETLSTLRFGQRAKAIKNKPTVNNEKSAKELLIKLKNCEEKLKNCEKLVVEYQLQIEKISKNGNNVVLTGNTEADSDRERDRETKLNKCNSTSNINTVSLGTPKKTTSLFSKADNLSTNENQGKTSEYLNTGGTINTGGTVSSIGNKLKSLTLFLFSCRKMW